VIALVWECAVRPGCEAEFERLHGADGEWTALSRRSRSYLGSSFLRDLAQPSHYLLIEYWSEAIVYERHHADFRDEIERLEQARTQLVEPGGAPGIFTALDVPDRSGPAWSRRGQ
jgi:hypothetical protein